MLSAPPRPRLLNATWHRDTSSWLGRLLSRTLWKLLTPSPYSENPSSLLLALSLASYFPEHTLSWCVPSCLWTYLGKSLLVLLPNLLPSRLLRRGVLAKVRLMSPLAPIPSCLL